MKNEVSLLNSLPDVIRPTVPVTIKTERDLYKIDILEGSVILYEALRAGIPLAYSCASGTCGTCISRVVEGRIEDCWSSAPGLSEKMRKTGRALLCQSAAVVSARLNAAEDTVSGRQLLHTPDYYSGRLVNKLRLAPGVIELQLQLDCALPFTPGQFILVWLQGLKGPRALSISNAGHSPVDQVRLLVKPRKGSDFDALLGPNSAIGMPIRVFGPLGLACLYDGEAHNQITCIAGSTGIAPMLSILFDWMRRGAPGSVQLVYGVRTSEDVVLLNEVADIAQHSGGRLKTIIALSEPRNNDVRALQEQVCCFAKVVAGYAHDATRELVNARPLSGVAFVSGPKPMVQATVKTLIVHGKLSPTAIRSDDFS